MSYKIILTITLFLFYNNLFSQTKEVVDSLNLKSEIELLNNEINDLIQKDNCFSKLKGLRFLNVIWMNYDGEPKKEDFLNYSFLKKLRPNYYAQKSLFKKKKYLDAHTLICDSTGCLVGVTNGRYIFHASRFDPSYGELFHLFQKGELDYVFYVCLTSIVINFGIKDQNVSVIKYTSTGLNFYTLEEFVNCCWDDFYIPLVQPKL